MLDKISYIVNPDIAHFINWISKVAINDDYIKPRSEKADEMIEISNYIITYNLIKEMNEGRG